MGKYLLIFFIFCVSSITYGQANKILVADPSFGAHVYQHDLDDYIARKNYTDTVGKTQDFLQILRRAKFLFSQKQWAFGAAKTVTYEDALTRAEEIFRIRSQVDKVLVIKNQRKMFLLKKGKTVRSFPIALGPRPVGQKEYEGDGRTPEGTYTLDWQRWKTPVFHSFHISYPNAIDSARAKAKGVSPGSNIMVHGTSKGIKRRKDWTNGCIALSNSDMIIFRQMVFQDTPIEIRK